MPNRDNHVCIFSNNYQKIPNPSPQKYPPVSLSFSFPLNSLDVTELHQIKEQKPPQRNKEVHH